ncbi:hypothetical protein [Streptomyces pristinaespiralis]|uniref:hypothetical protein n=1 Tax=Streptomyces pristinaespiralis TaxID=38300 RepID=UPI0038399162
MRRSAAAAIAVGVLLTAVACTEGGDPERGKPSEGKAVGAAQLCDGVFRSPSASKALETVTGAREFDPEGTGEGPAGAAETLKSEFEQAGVSKGTEVELCSVYASASSDLDDVSLEFALDGGEHLDSSEHADELTPYKVGRKALAGSKRASLYFECVSPLLGGQAEKAVILRGEISNRDEPTGDMQQLREANLTLLNAAAFALAGELRCEKRGGLSETAALERT